MATGTKDVWVEGVPMLEEPIVRRIFRSEKAAMIAWGTTGVNIFIMPRAAAVGDIRRQLWMRSKGECELCSTPITEQNSEMHEKLHRGQGGEISLDNSVLICKKCHKFQHKDRAPRWSKGEKK